MHELIPLQEARLEAAAAREREIENRGIAKAKEEAKARGLALPEDFNDAPPTVADKLLSALPYTLPLMDALTFGSHIFQTFPTQVRVPIGWFVLPPAADFIRRRCCCPSCPLLSAFFLLFIYRVMI